MLKALFLYAMMVLGGVGAAVLFVVAVAIGEMAAVGLCMRRRRHTGHA